jgi:hypothetical protein
MLHHMATILVCYGGHFEYQVSSISVRRVTCYDHFCVFQLFSMLVASMATAAILKKINPSQHNFTWHIIKG